MFCTVLLTQTWMGGEGVRLFRNMSEHWDNLCYTVCRDIYRSIKALSQNLFSAVWVLCWHFPFEYSPNDDKCQKITVNGIDFPFEQRICWMKHVCYWLLPCWCKAFQLPLSHAKRTMFVFEACDLNLISFYKIFPKQGQLIFFNHKKLKVFTLHYFHHTNWRFWPSSANKQQFFVFILIDGTNQDSN